MILRDLVQRNVVLRELDLYGNEIDDEGAQAIAEALKVCSLAQCVVILIR